MFQSMTEYSNAVGVNISDQLLKQLTRPLEIDPERKNIWKQSLELNKTSLIDILNEQIVNDCVKYDILNNHHRQLILTEKTDGGKGIEAFNKLINVDPKWGNFIKILCNNNQHIIASKILIHPLKRLKCSDNIHQAELADSDAQAETVDSDVQTEFTESEPAGNGELNPMIKQGETKKGCSYMLRRCFTPLWRRFKLIKIKIVLVLLVLLLTTIGTGYIGYLICSQLQKCQQCECIQCNVSSPCANFYVNETLQLDLVESIKKNAREINKEVNTMFTGGTKLSDQYFPLELYYGEKRKTVTEKSFNDCLNDHQDHVIAVVGRPGIGKTAFVTQIANSYVKEFNNSQCQSGTLLFSFDYVVLIYADKLINHKVESLEQAIQRTLTNNYTQEFLKEKILNNPRALLIFDGIELLNSEKHQSLLQVLTGDTSTSCIILFTMPLNEQYRIKEEGKDVSYLYVEGFSPDVKSQYFYTQISEEQQKTELFAKIKQDIYDPGFEIPLFAALISILVNTGNADFLINCQINELEERLVNKFVEVAAKKTGRKNNLTDHQIEEAKSVTAMIAVKHQMTREQQYIFNISTTELVITLEQIEIAKKIGFVNVDLVALEKFYSIKPKFFLYYFLAIGLRQNFPQIKIQDTIYRLRQTATNKRKNYFDEEHVKRQYETNNNIADLTTAFRTAKSSNMSDFVLMESTLDLLYYYLNDTKDFEILLSSQSNGYYIVRAPVDFDKYLRTLNMSNTLHEVVLLGWIINTESLVSIRKRLTIVACDGCRFELSNTPSNSQMYRRSDTLKALSFTGLRFPCEGLQILADSTSLELITFARSGFDSYASDCSLQKGFSALKVLMTEADYSSLKCAAIIIDNIDCGKNIENIVIFSEIPASDDSKELLQLIFSNIKKNRLEKLKTLRIMLPKWKVTREWIKSFSAEFRMEHIFFLLSRNMKPNDYPPLYSTLNENSILFYGYSQYSSTVGDCFLNETMINSTLTIIERTIDLALNRSIKSMTIMEQIQAAFCNQLIDPDYRRNFVNTTEMVQNSSYVLNLSAIGNQQMEL